MTLMQAAGVGLALIGISCGCLILAACLSIAGKPERRSGPGMIGTPRRALRQFQTLLGPVAGGALATGAACIILRSNGAASPTSLFTILPGMRAQVEAMPLSALFWLLLGVPLLAMGLFRAGDIPPVTTRAMPRDVTGPASDRGLPAVGIALAAVFLAMVTVADGLSLVLLWQAAATLLGMLILSDSSAPRHAGRGARRWLIRATTWHAALQAGGACLLAAMLLFDSGCGSLHYADLRTCGPQLEATRQSAIFLLTLLACGSAVVAPLLGRQNGHDLPLILAPRLALYPLLLVPFTLLGPGPAWWGVALIAIGAAMAPVGAMRCIAARSTRGLVRDGGIVQTGVVVICLGSALLLRHAGQAESVALEAALLCAVTGTAASTLLALAPLTPWRVADARHSSVPEGWWARAPFVVGLAGTVLLPTLGVTGGGWLAMQAVLAAAGSTAQGQLVGGLAACGAAALCLSAAMGIASVALLLGRAPDGALPSADRRKSEGQLPVICRAAIWIAGIPVPAVALAPLSVAALLRPAVQELAGGREIVDTEAGPLDAVEALAMHAHFSALGIVACLASYTVVCALGAQVLGSRSRQAAGTQPTDTASAVEGSPLLGMSAPSASRDSAVLAALILRRLQAPLSRIVAHAGRRPRGWSRPGARGGRAAMLRQRGRRAMPVSIVRLGVAVGGGASLLSLVALFVALLVLAR